MVSTLENSRKRNSRKRKTRKRKTKIRKTKERNSKRRLTGRRGRTRLGGFNGDRPPASPNNLPPTAADDAPSGLWSLGATGLYLAAQGFRKVGDMAERGSQYLKGTLAAAVAAPWKAEEFEDSEFYQINPEENMSHWEKRKKLRDLQREAMHEPGLFGDKEKRELADLEAMLRPAEVAGAQGLSAWKGAHALGYAG